MVGQWSISFRIISISAKIWKTTFPKEFLNEIWVIIGDYENINIAEIKIVTVFFPPGGILVENHIFPHPRKC